MYKTYAAKWKANLRRAHTAWSSFYKNRILSNINLYVYMYMYVYIKMEYTSNNNVMGEVNSGNFFIHFAHFVFMQCLSFKFCVTVLCL